MNPHSIQEVKEKAGDGHLAASIHAQLESNSTRSTRDGKPFLELVFVDSTDRFQLRIWSDHPAFHQMQELDLEAFFEVAGDFSVHPTYGLEVRNWTTRELEQEEIAALLQGSSEGGQRIREGWERIVELIESMADPRLKELCQRFVSEHGERFQRTAAARVYHHAQRGGLVLHVRDMMEAAWQISAINTQLNRDLLLAGCLLHDCGKLWETSYEADSFLMPYEEVGELLGHITVGIEVVNHLWHGMEEKLKEWKSLRPPSEAVRLHLLHLIASHHGELQFGSPVVPKTPEAIALHHIDNMDAKLEMMRRGYEQSKPLSPSVVERVWPLPGNLVRPLPPYQP